MRQVVPGCQKEGLVLSPEYLKYLVFTIAVP